MHRAAPTTFSIRAANLPEHARNPIHTDEGARAAGFERALVAGVTTYAYLTHPAAAAWGVDWLAHGGGEVRFRRPVCDGDPLRCTPIDDGDGVVIHALVDGSTDDSSRAQLRLIADSGPAPDLRAGETVPQVVAVLEGELGTDYGWRAGDTWPFYRDEQLVHPAVWPALANHVVHAHVARGSWIHTRSIVRHHALVRPGAVAVVDSVVVRRFESHGERAVLDVRICVDGRVVATLEHEAIVALP